jgi:hypothetical protein
MSASSLTPATHTAERKDTTWNITEEVDDLAILAVSEDQLREMLKTEMEQNGEMMVGPQLVL